ncbi:hypothetical protein CYD53_1172 [Bosea psychrotolerans]|uniref:YD repeat-containing protein n=1 Tax=Bosea psychrotolerans TaxID=1871628 RepID=A0A2S4LZA1_9HYPH|nr:hypothetical protein CYD53_1172 [Bosea psychrotolerans]
MMQVTTNCTVTRTYAYDDACNIVTEMQSASAWSFTHSAASHSSQASLGGTLKGSYSYYRLEWRAIRAAINTPHRARRI